jgi:hypothetical protein
MSRTLTAFLAVGAIGISACGSSAHFADKPRPPTPVDLTVYVNDARVSISPASVGAGPVIFYVTNQASRTESVNIESASGRSLATTGPINPQQTAQVQVDFSSGEYRVATSGGSSVPPTRPIRAASLRIGAPRPNADNALLQP